MVDVSTSNNKNNITISTVGNKANITATPDTALYYSEKAREWAISNKLVSGEDYSSKYYANISKQQAESVGDKVAEVNNAAQEAIINITNQETISVDNVNTAGETQVNLATEQANIATQKAQEAVNTVDNAISNIVEQETISKNNVVATGNEQIELIQNEGAEQVANIQSTSDAEYEKIIATGIETRANTDLSNLTEEGLKLIKDSSPLEPRITNCLKEVPQRINYTLADGTLTLKAGSVLIFPYGTEDLTETYPVGSTFLDNFEVYDTSYADGKFFVLAKTKKDASSSRTWGQIISGLAIMIQSGSLTSGDMSRFASGDTQPTLTGTIGAWYDTADNYCRYWDGTDFTSGGITSLPIMSVEFSYLVSDENYAVGSVSQVFNGAGFIGTTFWVDKGINMLIPNGRNQDGTLKNKEVISSKICIKSALNNTKYYLTSGGNWCVARATFVYNEEENLNYFDHSSSPYYEAVIGTIIGGGTSGISSIQLKQPFRAVDYNDISALVPAGTVVSSASSDIPAGYLYCNGSAVSRTTYANLFLAIGTTYGAGDGSTTFNLPNYTGYKFVTSSTVSVKGTGKALGMTTSGNTGGLSVASDLRAIIYSQNYNTAVGTKSGTTVVGSSGQAMGVVTDASNSGLTGTASTATLKWYIKY